MQAAPSSQGILPPVFSLDEPILGWSALFAFCFCSDERARPRLDAELNRILEIHPGLENPVARVLRARFDPPVLLPDNQPNICNLQLVQKAKEAFATLQHLDDKQRLDYIAERLRTAALAGKGRRPAIVPVHIPKPLDPPLTWEGKKTNMVPWIRGAVGCFPGKNQLVEPFVGSGAVFLNLDYRQYLLCDFNPYLINFYGQIQRWEDPVAALRKLYEFRKYPAEDERDESEEEEEVEEEEEEEEEEPGPFRISEEELRRRAEENSRLSDTGTFHRELSFGHMTQAIVGADSESQAHMFLHLNKESVLGKLGFLQREKELRKVNEKTGLKRLAPRSLQANLTPNKSTLFPGKKLVALATKIESSTIQFACQDYRLTLSQARVGDVIYCDPPYFGTETIYGDGFSSADQIEFVTRVGVKAFQDSVPVVVSNLCTESSKLLYLQYGAWIYDITIRTKGRKTKERRELIALFCPGNYNYFVWESMALGAS